ncbi:MAG: hypothetical protein AAF696_38205, partial [Bacteroidota bacterium]
IVEQIDQEHGSNNAKTREAIQIKGKFPLKEVELQVLSQRGPSLDKIDKEAFKNDLLEELGAYSLPENWNKEVFINKLFEEGDKLRQAEKSGEGKAAATADVNWVKRYLIRQEELNHITPEIISSLEIWDKHFEFGQHHVLEEKSVEFKVQALGEKEKGGIKGDDLEIYVCFVDKEALKDEEVFVKMVEEIKPYQFRRVTDAFSKGFKTEEYAPKPMLFIGTDNLMELAHKDEQGKSQSSEEEKALIDAIHQQIDPRFRHIDSSIWNQYLPVVPARDFTTRLRSKLKDFLRYHMYGLYRSVVAREYLEFQTRKFIQSYVQRSEGGHSKDVTPFRFHSESKMKEKADEIRDRLGDFSWTCLLIDDYAHRPLRSIKGPNTRLLTDKKVWIEALLEADEINSADDKGKAEVNLLNPVELEGFALSGEDKRPPSGFEGFLDYFGQYLNRLNHRRPDILILDYFFGREETNLKQKYGHKFISKLLEEVKPNSPSLAFKKYWIFPISGFEHAFTSHLRLMGDSVDNEYLEMGDGADPINSPQLFRYLFYSFLDFQQKTVLSGLKSILI